MPSIICVLPSCNSLYSSVELCMKHLISNKGANILITEHDFVNMDAFPFKTTEESKRNCVFVRAKGVEKL